MMTFVDNFTPKNPLYFCEKCDFISGNKKDYMRHMLTLKHRKQVGMMTNLTEKPIKNPRPYCCECGRDYATRQGLHVHRKKCKMDFIETETVNDEPSSKELLKLISQLMKSHNGLQDSILEICKNATNTNNTTITQTNSNNKTFNLNMFLNETCKDAMNITDFVDSIKLQLSDLENVGEVGYVKGISNIIVKNLNALDITKRPVHCADKKREVLYIKDDDKWEKEDDDNKKLRKMIRRVAFKNYKQISQFKAKYPDCDKSESRYSDKYNKIIVESMGGAGDNEKENEDKIIRNISKEVVINKDS